MPIEMPKGLPFSVDTWTSNSKSKTHHFLTHAHKDHSHGILSHATFPIFCTKLTKSLLLLYYPLLDDRFFVQIEVGESLVIEDPDANFSVTAFDANHCPGAVMFLFEGRFGNILHTGDCRLIPEILQCLPEKYVSKKGRKPSCPLDYVFLDCTFGKSSFKMPSRQSAIQQGHVLTSDTCHAVMYGGDKCENCSLRGGNNFETGDDENMFENTLAINCRPLVINCIWKHPGATTVYLTCDLLGQEEVLSHVCQTFGCKIYVDKEKDHEYFRVLELLVPEVLTDDSSSRFHLFNGFPKLFERAEAKIAEANANSLPEPLIIRPSAQWYVCEEEFSESQSKRKRCDQAIRDTFGVWHVCYTMHSSKDELEWALQLLSPKWIISTTPSCRAMELDYAKKCCFNNNISGDSLSKLMDITFVTSSAHPLKPNTPVKRLSCSPLAETILTCDVESPTQSTLPQSTVVRRSRRRLLNLSPDSKQPSVTLFGRARLGIRRSLCENDPETELEDHISSSKISAYVEDTNLCRQTEEVSVQTVECVKFKPEEQLEKNEGRVLCVSTEKLEYGSDSNIGSSKNLDESLKSLYRSMNVSVPRPLPSLVEMMKRTRCGRRQF